jgi:putative transcriptional regulator
VNFESTKRPAFDDRAIDVLLARYAARTLAAPEMALVESHLEMKPDSRAYVAALEAAHGIFLAELDPVPLPGRNRKLVNIFASDAAERPAALADGACAGPPTRPGSLPRALRQYGDIVDLAWKTVWPGIEQAVVATGAFGEASFLRCQPGTRFPAHGHGGAEAMLVVSGSIADQFGQYGPGDVVIADEMRVHQPEVADHELLAFLVTHDRLRPDGSLARLFGIVLGR